MSTTRVFVKRPPNATDTIPLEVEVLHYLKRVRRLRDGDEFVVLDGKGGCWKATLKGHQASLGEAHPCAHGGSNLHLYLALGKGERFDRAIEKAAELGAAQVTPIETERTQVKSPGEKKLERWNRLALSGSALAFRCLPLKVNAPVTLGQALAQAQKGLVFTAGHPYPEARQLVAANLFIGPEGGFTETELESAVEAGFELAGLGPFNLRVETAATAALAVATMLLS